MAYISEGECNLAPLFSFSAAQHLTRYTHLTHTINERAIAHTSMLLNG